jgi:hypothetical protein
VDIDPATASYLGIGYNIVSIEFYRVKLGDPEFERFSDLEIFPSASNQTHFEKDWTPRSSDLGMYQFAAFVHTMVHDAAPLPLLEIADDTRKQVEVQGVCAPGLFVSKGAALTTQQQQTSGNCQVNGTVHSTTVSDFPDPVNTHYEWTRDTTVTFEEQIAIPVQAHFVPKGTCTMSYHGSGGGCSKVATFKSCDLPPDDSGSLTLNIDNSTDPPTYTYYAEIYGVVTVHVVETCGTSTSEYDLTSNERLLIIPVEDTRTIAADGSVTGTRTEVQTPPGGSITDTWTWDLKLEVPQPPPGP